MTFSRRTMYFTSLVLTIICLNLFSTFSYLISTSSDLVENVFSLQVASLLSSCLLVISVQLGVQTLPLLLSGELFPADVRATCKVRPGLSKHDSPHCVCPHFLSLFKENSTKRVLQLSSQRGEQRAEQLK